MDWSGSLLFILLQREDPMTRILVADALSQAGVDVLSQHYDVDVRTGLSEAELIEVIGDYDAIVVRSATQVTAPVLEAATKLKVVARAGVGLDNVDIDAATQRGVLVCNAPQSNVVSAAEHAIALLMSLARHIPTADAGLRDNQWLRNKLKGVELYGKTLGVVGLGRIGGLVCERLRGFGMDIVGYDPFINAQRAEAMKVKLVETVDQVCEQADILTVHLPRTPETIGIIGKDQLAKMKPSALVINAARGGLIDEDALFEALRDGVIAGAALDVFDVEPPQDHPLLTLDNVVATPHLGASTVEAQDKAGTQVAEAVVAALAGEFVPSAVNLSVSGQVPELTKRFMPLAQQLGNLFLQIVPWAGTPVEIEFLGDIATEDTRAAQLAVLRGLLAGVVSEPVTFVNAPQMAKSRGLDVSTIKRPGEHDWTSEIVIRSGAYSIGGTLGGINDQLRLVEVDGMPLDVGLAPHMLVLRYTDRPGVIGHIGQLLGEANINIGSMQVARTNHGGTAVCVLTVDTVVPEALAHELGERIGAQSVDAVTLDM